MCACSYRPNTNSVCLFFQKMPILPKKLPFSVHNHPKTQFSWFFGDLLFSFFSSFSFSFSNCLQQKRQKQKMHFLFRKPCFDAPTTCKNNSHPYTLFVFFFGCPQRTLKLGKNKQKKSWTDFWLNLGQIFDSKKAKSWTDFWLYSIFIYIYVWLYIYISIYMSLYIYVHAYAAGLIWGFPKGPFFEHLMS